MGEARGGARNARGVLLTSTLLTLLVLPVLYRMFHEEPHEELHR